MTPRPIPASVRALLPLCGAQNDHEALGACRGVGRKLQASGLDWHDLAAAIPTGETNVDNIHVEFSRRRENPTGAGWIRPFDTYSWRHAFTPAQESEHRTRVRFCQDHAWRLTAWEREFVNSICKLHGNLSIRQGDCLAAMTDRLDMEVRRAC